MTVLSKINTKIKKHSKIIIFSGFIIILFILYSIFKNKQCLTIKNNLIGKISECNSKIQNIIKQSTTQDKVKEQNYIQTLITEYNKLLQHLHQFNNNELVNIVDDLCQSSDIDTILKKHNIILDEIFKNYPESKQSLLNSVQSLCKVKVLLLSKNEDINSILKQKEIDLEKAKNEMTILFNKNIDELKEKLRLKEEELQKLNSETNVKVAALDQRIIELTDKINILNPISAKIPELEKEITDLKAEKDILIKNLEDKKNEYNVLQQNFNEIKLSNTELDEKINVLTQLNTVKDKRLSNLIKGIRSMQTKNKQKQTELLNQIETLETTLNQKEIRLNEFEKLMEESKEKQTELREKRRKQESILEELHNAAKERLNRPDLDLEYFHYRIIDKICEKDFIENNLDDSLKPIAYTICQLSDKYDKLENSHINLRTKYNQVLNERNAIETELNKKINQYNLLNTTKVNLESTLNELKINYENVVNEYNQSKLEYEKNKKVVETNIENLKSQIEQNESLIERLKNLNPDGEDSSIKLAEIKKLKDEIASYKSSIEDNAKTINEFKNKVNELTNSKQLIEQEKNKVQKQYDELNNVYQKEVLKYQKIEKELNELLSNSNIKYNTKEKDFIELQKKYKLQSDEVEKMKIDMIKMENTYKQLMNKYNQIKSELEISTSTSTSFSSDIEKLKSELKISVENMNKLQSDYDNLSILMSTKNKEIEKISKQLIDKESEYQVNLSNEQKSKQALNVELSELQNKLKESENSLKNMTTKFDTLNQKYNNLVTKSANSDETITKYIESITILEKKNKELITEVETLRNDYNTLLLLNPKKENVEDLRTKLENELKTIRLQFNEKVKNYNDLEKTSKEVKTELEKLKLDLKNKEADRNKVISKVEKVNDELVEKKKEIELLQTKIKELTSMNETNVKQFGLDKEKLNESIKSLGKKIDELTISSNNLEREREKLENSKDLEIEDLKVKLKLINDLNDEMEQSKNKSENELINLKKEYTDLTSLMNKKVEDLNKIIDNLENNINNIQNNVTIYTKELDNLNKLNEQNERKYKELIGVLEKDIDNICGSDVPSELTNVCNTVKRYQKEVSELKSKNLKEISKFKVEIEEKNKITTSLNKKIGDIQSQLKSYTELLQRTLNRKNLEYFRYFTDEIKENICNITYINNNLEEPIRSVAKTICELSGKYDSLLEIKKTIENEFQNELKNKDVLNNKITILENEIKNYKDVIVKDLLNEKNVIEEDKEKIKNEYSSKVNELQKRYNQIFNLLNMYDPEKIEQLNDMCSLSNENRIEQIKKVYEVSDQSKVANISNYLLNLCKLKNDVSELEEIRKKYNDLLIQSKSTDDLISKLENENLISEQQLEQMKKDKDILTKGYSLIYDEFEDEYKGELKEMCSSDNINTIRQKYKNLNNLLTDNVVKNILSKICDTKLRLRLNLSAAADSKIQFEEVCDEERNELLRLKEKAGEKLVSLNKISLSQIQDKNEQQIYTYLRDLFERGNSLDSKLLSDCSVVKNILSELIRNPIYKTYETTSANFLEDYQGQVRTYIKIKPFDINFPKPPAKYDASDDFNRLIDKRSFCGYTSGNTKNSIIIDCSRDETHCKEGSISKEIFNDFTDIYGPSINNENLYKRMKSLFDQMKSGYSIVVFGYGLSGSGKTFTLLGDSNNKGLINYVLFDKNNGIKGVKLAYAFELYSTDVPKVDTNFKVKSTSEGVINAKIINYKDYSTKSNLNDIVNLESKNINVTSDEDLTNILKEIETDRKNELRIKPTPNNPESSRSHLFLVFKVTFDNGKSGYCTFIDTAGRESPFTILEQVFKGKTKQDFGNTIRAIKSDLLKMELNKPIIDVYDKSNYLKISGLKDTAISALYKSLALDTLKEGMYVNESINHLVWFFNNKANKEIKFNKMSGKIYDKYENESVFTTPNDEATISIKDSNVRIIPILNKLASLGGENTKSKFVMLCMVRQEITYCDEAKKTLQFASSIKST